MKQEIICEKGKCIELDTLENELESNVKHGNIVDEIRFDLLKEAIS